MCYRTGIYTVCRHVHISFSPEMLQAGALQGLMSSHVGLTYQGQRLLAISNKWKKNENHAVICLFPIFRTCNLTPRWQVPCFYQVPFSHQLYRLFLLGIYVILSVVSLQGGVCIYRLVPEIMAAWMCFSAMSSGFGSSCQKTAITVRLDNF